MRLSDTIERFIKEMLSEDAQQVDLKRNELAEYFHCAPSQINYVLQTRFTPDHGYVIESQRGGGGFIRIVRVQRTGGEQLRYLLSERIGDRLSFQTAQVLVSQLVERGVLTRKEALIMLSAVSDGAMAVPLPEELKEALRAKMLKNMLIAAARGEE